MTMQTFPNGYPDEPESSKRTGTDEWHERVIAAETESRFKVGDKIAAAVLTYKHAALRVGVIEKIHPPTGSISETRFTIRDENNRPCVVSSARSVLIEADEHHTMKELYEYRMLYNAATVNAWTERGAHTFKSYRHYDGELCFGGGWFIVGILTIEGWVTNQYQDEHWDLFDAPEVDTAPEWDGHTPAEAAQRLRNAL
jgi:hypothetical protein